MAYERKRPPLDPCPLETVFNLVSGKWKARILWALADEPHTFGGLRNRLGRVTQQVLSAQLKALEEDGLVGRHQNGPAPNDGSTYRLTSEAESLLAAFEAVALWGAARLRRQGQIWSADQDPFRWRTSGTDRGRPRTSPA